MKIQTKEFSLDEKLRSLDNNSLYKLIIHIKTKNPEVHTSILEWLKNCETIKSTGEKNDLLLLNDSLLTEYWENAKEIISKFNEYGGGSEEDEEEAIDWLCKILSLAKGGKISSETKFEILDEVFSEYIKGNSGLDDTLMDTLSGICETEEEWEFLVKKLKDYPSSWHNELIMDIQKQYLCNDNEFLEMRMQNLHFGRNYMDLVHFYIEKNNLLKALEIAEQGIFNAEGRLTELFEYLFDHFSRTEDTKNIERIVHTALTRGKEEKNMLDRLFEYYKSQGNYEKAKSTLLIGLEHIGRTGYYTEYKKMKKFLKKSDWGKIEPIIFENSRENIQDYLHICILKMPRLF